MLSSHFSSARCSKGRILLLLFSCCFFNHVISQCPSTNVVQNPEAFIWTYHPAEQGVEAHFSGVIEVGEETFTINGETLTTRAYRQEGGTYSIPGPTISVVPGNKYILRFHNTLPYEPKSEDHNVFKDANVSNIHTHGLHISGESPGDDVTRSFEGGRGGDFVWDIPSDHMGGTFWYHAHHHGSSFLQVSGGLFGLLIVDDGNDQIPANVAAMTERELIFGFLDPAAAGTGGDVLMSGTLSSTWTVNGLVQGNICMPPNTWEHWRVLLADRNANMKDIEFGPGIEVMLLARDGVWRTVAPKAIPSNTLKMTGASRADFAIRATSDSWIKVDGDTVANIYVSGAEDPNVHPYDTVEGVLWSAVRPHYLRDLRGETNVNNESVSMGARTINGSKYNNDVPTISLPAEQVQEWSLSGAVQHPFHLHVYHVQALKDDNDFEAGEYYDVVASKMSVRFDLNQNTSTVYDGRTILHCHILSHEDRGAMGWLDVLGGTPAPTFPNNGLYSEYYVLGGGQSPPQAPSGLSAVANSSSDITLNWSDNSGDEDGFNVERSTDGVNFNFLVSVGADVVSYNDPGLPGSTTFYYRVSAYNNAGSSDYSNIASASTFPSGGDVFIHVENIEVSRVNLNGNRVRGEALVTVLDDSNAPVPDAAVSGIFTGTSTSEESGTTDANGQVSLSTRALKNPQGEWCFEVTDVNLAGATYDASSNLVTIACESGPVASSSRGVFDPDSSFIPMEATVKVYPNPAGDIVNISVQLSKDAPARIEIYSITGERISVLANEEKPAGTHLIQYRTNILNSGMYFLHIRVGDAVQKLKLIKH